MHAGSRVVLPTGSVSALSSAELAPVCTQKGPGLSADRGKPRASMMSDKHGEWRGARPASKQIAKRWEAPGGEEEEKQPGKPASGARTLSSVFFSLSFTLLPLLQRPCWKSEPLHQPIRQWGFEVARGSESLLVISPPLSTRSAVPFQASASLSRQDYTQSHDHCWDFKAPFNGQDNAMKQNQTGWERRILGGKSRKGCQWTQLSSCLHDVEIYKHEDRKHIPACSVDFVSELSYGNSMNDMAST